MSRPHIASVVEDAFHRRLATLLTGQGWGHRIVPHTGYGGPDFVRVFGRVLMSRHGRAESDSDDAPRGPIASLRAAEDELRGWRAFIAAPAARVPVTVRVGDQVLTTRTDRGGYIDLKVTGHGLSGGWHRVVLSTPQAHDVEAAVLIVGAEQRFGVVSDIDDTILATSLPRPLIATWNTMVRVEAARRPVPGMATLYREVSKLHPGAPYIYLSTGAWNTQPWLVRFLRRNGYPLGPMLLTDWGPTNTGWFRSGQTHKISTLHRLARELPHVQWLLVGDDGQHDPKIYTEFAHKRPDRVVAVAIRQLGVSEQVLSHGLPVANEAIAASPAVGLQVPVVRAGDGYALARLLRPLLRLGLTGRGPAGSVAAAPQGEPGGEPLSSAAAAVPDA